jgi:hypothetical protein
MAANQIKSTTWAQIASNPSTKQIIKKTAAVNRNGLDIDQGQLLIQRAIQKRDQRAIQKRDQQQDKKRQTIESTKVSHSPTKQCTAVPKENPQIPTLSLPYVFADGIAQNPYIEENLIPPMPIQQQATKEKKSEPIKKHMTPTQMRKWAKTQVAKQKAEDEARCFDEIKRIANLSDEERESRIQYLFAAATTR